jgi:hypothetical protein
MVSDYPFDDPSGADLLTYIIPFLEEGVLPELEGRPQYLTRVTLSGLRMLERELRQGPQVRAHFTAELSDRGFESEQALTEAIRAAGDDEIPMEVKALVFEWTKAKLRISNPKYLEPGS